MVVALCQIVRKRSRITIGSPAAREPGEGVDQGGCARSGATASWAASHRACGYDPSDAAVGGHAPIRCRNATILPR
jgi:hypothetical protein